jgi:hypothetical protein
MTNRKRSLAIAAALAAVVVGAGAALAASGSDNPASSFLGDVAKKLGISESKLTDAIKAAQLDRIDAAVARGDLTKEQGEALKERVRSGEAPEILPGFRGLGPGLGLGPRGHGHGFGRHGFGFGFGFPGLGHGDVLQTAADYLGLTQAELRTALREGKSLAEVAKSKGKSVDGLKEAITKGFRADIDKAVKDGVLTKEQGDRLAEGLSKGVDRLVDQGLGRLHLELGDERGGFRFEFRMDDRGPGARFDFDGSMPMPMPLPIPLPEPDASGGTAF